MKAQFLRKDLLAACKLASLALAPRRSNIKPILTSFKLAVQDSQSTLEATDLEVGLRYTLPQAGVEEPGEAILPAARLLDVLNVMDAGELTLESNATQCRISAGFDEYEMPTEDPQNFPEVPGFDADKHHEFIAKTLKAMVERTVFSAAQEASKFAMTGVLWELEDNTARLIATDSKRLAVTRGQATGKEGHTTKDQTTLVPSKAMELLGKLLNDDDFDTVKVAFRRNEVFFQTKNATLYSRLVEGRFPPWQQIIPRKADTKVVLTVDELHQAVRRARVMADQESLRVTFKFEPSKLTLSAQGAATGRSKVEMPIELQGPELEIHLDPEYLTEMLKVLDKKDTVTWEFSGGTKPCLFRGPDQFQYLVMPLY